MESKSEVRAKPTRGIKILNPPANCGGYTSLAKARNMIRRERAEWVEDRRSIRLTEAHRHLRATKLAAFNGMLALQRKIEGLRAANKGYDDIERTMTLDEMGNIPFTGGDLVRLLIKR